MFQQKTKMNQVFVTVISFMCLSGFVLGLSGCSFFRQNEDDIVLIRVGEKTTTVGDFKRIFEITKTAYPHNALQESSAYEDAQLRLLNQLTEEMIILERAEEAGIKISNSELEKAISKIKSDYPKGVFEKMLLENAVSYDSWKERLRTRLIMQKTIESEVESKIEITPDDISKYYKEKRKKEASEMDTDGIKNENEEVIVAELRREKAEEKYRKWIKELQDKYTIEINNEAWEKIKNS